MDIFLLFESDGYSIMTEGMELEYHRYYKNILSLDNIRETVESLSEDISIEINRYTSDKETLRKINFVFQDRFLLFKRMDIPKSSRESDIKNIFEIEIMKKHRIDKDVYTSCFSKSKSDIEGYKSIGYTIFPKYYLELASRVKNNTNARTKSVCFYLQYVDKKIPTNFEGIFVLFRYADAIIYSISKGMIDNTMVITEKSLDNSVIEYLRSSKNKIFAGIENSLFKKIGLSMDMADNFMLVDRENVKIDIVNNAGAAILNKILVLSIVLLAIAIILNVYVGISRINLLQSELKESQNSYTNANSRKINDNISTGDLKLYSKILPSIGDRLIFFKASRNFVEIKFECDSKKDLYDIMSNKELRDFYLVSLEEKIIVEKEKSISSDDGTNKDSQKESEKKQVLTNEVKNNVNMNKKVEDKIEENKKIGNKVSIEGANVSKETIDVSKASKKSYTVYIRRD